MHNVHVSGKWTKANKKGLKAILEFWTGEYVDDTDKGAIFGFSKESDATGFSRDVNGRDNRVKNMFADDISM